MVTIKDVARKAGVSISTVSRVMSGNIFVEEDTKEKVLKVIKELDYTPNFFAKGLKGKKTGTIGLVIPNINNPIFYNVILCNTDENIDNEKEIINMLKKKWIDGLILTPASKDYEYMSKIRESNIPVVLMIRNFKNMFDSVVTNNFEASYEAVKYLIQRGRKKIIIINGDLSVELYRERFEGCKKAIIDSGMKFMEEISFRCSFENKECYLKTLNFIKSNPTICDAIFAANDLRAIEVIKAVKDAGLMVPDDISVIGFDNIEISSMIDPSLTTVAQPLYEIGEISVKRLLKLINSKDRKQKPKLVVVKSQLLIRNSTC